MEGKFTLTHKIKSVIALVVSVLMILATNMMDNNHFAFVQESFESIYKDRLVVNDYIFRISRLVEEKKTRANDMKLNEGFEYDNHSSDSIDLLITKYAATKFSNEEELYFINLKKKIIKLKNLEKELAEATSPEESSQILIKINHNVSLILDDLTNLSDIQLTEAKRLFDSSNKLIHNSYMISRWEIAFLIIIGSLILTLITVKPAS